MTSSLAGKVALVTGASSGIGEATALALAQANMRVAVAGRRVERLTALVDRITTAGGQAFAVPADVSIEAQARALVEQTRSHFGQLDVLVNNAGLMLQGMIDGADTEEWRRMIGVNLLGLMYVTHAALPVMKAQGAGHIVNLSSVAGRIANPRVAVYAATKFGVCAFSEALRREVKKDGIRVTVVEPGIVATELAEHITDAEAKEALKARISALTPLESEDVAAAILYALTQPARVNVNEILIRPTLQD
ncbi:MAG TPA: SDR family NAD(P)-dependent oxidoreductase [Polyangiaceae bacterium]|jgi:NADP-dependent 3-hydroxy acid dehydrogenase YdfG|nr:SDR family NAD(P)-dependent oxidoreductase [Polyangiaceae bacterium]